jgi:TolB-like protein
MRSSLLLAVSLSVTAFAEPPTVAVVDFEVVGGDARLGAVYAERLASHLEDRGLKVVTQQTIRSILTVERQKQLLGCGDDSSSCLTELAGALGSSYLMLGQVARVGASFTVNVRAVQSASGATVSSTSKTVGSEEASLVAVGEAADAFVFTLDPTLARPLVAPWLVAGLGAATAAAGLVFLFRVADANATLRGPVRADFSVDDAFKLAQARAPEQPVGIALLVGGGAALVTGIVWWALGRSPRLAVALSHFVGPTWLASW